MEMGKTCQNKQVRLNWLQGRIELPYTMKVDDEEYIWTDTFWADLSGPSEICSTLEVWRLPLKLTHKRHKMNVLSCISTNLWNDSIW